jgi:arylsulfatase A-like enzyme
MGSIFESYDDSLEVWEAATLGAMQRDGDKTLDAALSWLDRTADRPFFLLLHLFEPHSPYEPDEPFRSRYADPYDGEIATVDAQVGTPPRRARSPRPLRQVDHHSPLGSRRGPR